MSALLDLRTTLSSVLAGELGTYTLANGSIVPAVRCSDATETRYPGTIVQGLEMVILKDPRMVSIRQYQQERVQAEWSVFLVGWGDRPAGIAAQKVVDAIPGCDVERVSVPEGIGPIDQYQLTIRSLSALPLDALVPEDQGADLTLVLNGDYELDSIPPVVDENDFTFVINGDYV
tara:strand:+ start:115 stop:639 length:525 start_codon:yes stop_codon:yes gene_type:complete